MSSLRTSSTREKTRLTCRRRAAARPLQQLGNSQLVGMALYTSYLLPFEIASILLLVAIVGAVVLVEEENASGGLIAKWFLLLIT